MQQKSGDVLHKRKVVREKVEIDELFLEKSQRFSTEEQQLGRNEDSMSSELKIFERRRNIVAVPSTKDILCGRGKAFFNHEGNKRFRDIVDRNISAYVKASQRSKRSKVVKAVVAETLGTGARFLKRLENKLEWYDGGDKVAREKVGHALRDATSNKSQKISKKTLLLQKRKQRERFLENEKKTKNCDATKKENLEDETVRISSFGSLLARRAEKDVFMESLINNSTYLNDPQMPNVNYCNQNPIQAESSLFSVTYPHTDLHDIFSKRREFGSLEYEDGFHHAAIKTNEQVATCFPSDHSTIAQNEVTRTHAGQSRSHLPSLEKVQKPKLRNDKLHLMGEPSLIFSETSKRINLTEEIAENRSLEMVENVATPLSTSSRVCQNIPYLNEPKTLNFKNKKRNSTMEVASSMYHGAVEYPNQIFVATPKNHKEQGITLQIFLHCKENKY